MTPDLKELCDACGVATGYWDQTGTWRETSPATALAVLRAMGVPVTDEDDAGAVLLARRAEAAARPLPRYIVVDAGEAWDIEGAGDWTLVTEAGERLEGRFVEGPMPSLPPGIHWLETAGVRAWVLSAPPHLPLPPKGWGVTLPLYGLWEAEGDGLGHLGHLAAFARGLGAQGAAFVGMNPLHAGFFPDPAEISPYAPSHRRRLNAAHVAPAAPASETPGDLVEYPAAFAARVAALEADFRAADETAFARWLDAAGPEMLAFATHQALAEVHGPFWTDWPDALRDPTAPEVAAFAGENAERVRFHAWLQFEAERQLAAASEAAGGMALGLYLDIAVGTHPGGAETWLEPGAFAQGVSLGAPPDAFSKEGQVWGLAPLNPDGLIASGFRQVAEMLRMSFRFAKLVRIDHILGFERTFWIPEGGLPGTYVKMPKDALLAVARIEAARAGGTIIGEDLGNVPEGLQGDLAASGLLGCRLVMFELDHEGWARPRWEYPETVLASFGTHDLPTLAGWRAGRDIAVREGLGVFDGDAAGQARDHRGWEVSQLALVAGGTGAQDVERFLAECSARLVALQIEDILGITEQPNLPGTVETYPNWRRRLPAAVSDILADPRLARAAQTMQAGGRRGETDD